VTWEDDHRARSDDDDDEDDKDENDDDDEEEEENQVQDESEEHRIAVRTKTINFVHTANAGYVSVSGISLTIRNCRISCSNNDS